MSIRMAHTTTHYHYTGNLPREALRPNDRILSVSHGMLRSVGVHNATSGGRIVGRVYWLLHWFSE